MCARAAERVMPRHTRCNRRTQPSQNGSLKCHTRGTRRPHLRVTRPCRLIRVARTSNLTASHTYNARGKLHTSSHYHDPLLLDRKSRFLLLHSLSEEQIPVRWHTHTQTLSPWPTPLTLPCQKSFATCALGSSKNTRLWTNCSVQNTRKCIRRWRGSEEVGISAQE